MLYKIIILVISCIIIILSLNNNHDTSVLDQTLESDILCANDMSLYSEMDLLTKDLVNISKTDIRCYHGINIVFLNFKDAKDIDKLFYFAIQVYNVNKNKVSDFNGVRHEKYAFCSFIKALEIQGHRFISSTGDSETDNWYLCMFETFDKQLPMFRHRSYKNAWYKRNVYIEFIEDLGDSQLIAVHYRQ